MSKTTTELPFTEIVETVMSLGRVNPNAINRVRGIVNDIYTRDIPTKHDWNFLISSSAITTVPAFTTGNATVTTGSRIVTFSSDVTLIDSMNGRKIKFSGNEVVYEITSFISAQSAQILPPFQGAANISVGAYSIFQPVYPLANDFDRFPKDGGVYKWTGASKEALKEAPYQEYLSDYAPNPSVPETVRLAGMDTAGNTLIEFSPPPKDERIYSYDYYKKLSPMMETSAGHINSISAKATSVIGYTTARFAEVDTNSRTINYFRIDVYGKAQDSQWYPIINIADDSALTLRVAFANSAVTTSANYTISAIPQMPTMLHPAITYGALAHILADQNDDNAALYVMRYAQVMSDSKKQFVSRTYSQDIHGIQEDWQYRR